MDQGWDREQRDICVRARVYAHFSLISVNRNKQNKTILLQEIQRDDFKQS